MKRKAFIVLLIVASLFLSSFTVYASTEDVGGFVTRLYDVCLHRAPDEKGYNDWVSALESKEKTGAQVAYGFVFSNEFRNKSLCDSCFLDNLYLCFFDRLADEEGKADWMAKLAAGATKGEVFNGFIGSQEFTNLCNSYGIERGTGDWSKEDMPFIARCGQCDSTNDNRTEQSISPKFIEFIKRLYVVCLDREADERGLNHWITKAKQGETASQIAFGFIFSQEFINKNLCDQHFVEYMYRAFFGREADEMGKSDWMYDLAKGATKGEIFQGFIGSKEFHGLCGTYNVDPGYAYYGNHDFKQNSACPFPYVPLEHMEIVYSMAGQWEPMSVQDPIYSGEENPLVIKEDGTLIYKDKSYWFDFLDVTSYKIANGYDMDLDVYRFRLNDDNNIVWTGEFELQVNGNGDITLHTYFTDVEGVYVYRPFVKAAN